MHFSLPYAIISVIEECCYKSGNIMDKIAAYIPALATSYPTGQAGRRVEPGSKLCDEV